MADSWLAASINSQLHGLAFLAINCDRVDSKQSGKAREARGVGNSNGRRQNQVRRIIELCLRRNNWSRWTGWARPLFRRKIPLGNLRGAVFRNHQELYGPPGAGRLKDDAAARFRLE